MCRRHFQHLGESAMQVMRRLRARPDGQLSLGIFDGDRRVLLNRKVSAPLVEKSVFENLVRFGERFLNVAELQRYTFPSSPYS
jgi:hypothetical protein